MSFNQNDNQEKNSGSIFFDQKKREPRPINIPVKEEPQFEVNPAFNDDDEGSGKKIAGVIIPILAVLMLFALIGGVYYMMNKDDFNGSS